MRAWWGFGFAAVLIAAAYVADVVVGDAQAEAARTFSGSSVYVLEMVARIGVIAAVLGLAWLVFHGPRSRLVGLVMVLVGGYVGLVPQLSLVVLANTDIQMPPLAMELLGQATGFAMWAATGMGVLGVVELLAPTRSTSQVGLVSALGTSA